jgi:hypothetical protein
VDLLLQYYRFVKENRAERTGPEAVPGGMPARRTVSLDLTEATFTNSVSRNPNNRHREVSHDQ